MNINTRTKITLASILLAATATACGTATASDDARDAGTPEQTAEPRIYPPTNIPEYEVPPRIYPPEDVPVIDVTP
jgi:hypothetical protein